MNTTLDQLKSDVDALRSRQDMTDSRTMETTRLLTDLKTQTGREFEQLAESYVKPAYKLVKAAGEDILKIDRNIADIKADVSGLKEDVAEVKADVSGLKEDVAEVKADVSGIKTDVAALTLDMDFMSTRVQVFGHATTTTMSDVKLLKGEFAGMKNEFAGMKKEFAGMTTDVADLRDHTARVDDRMDRMDRNIGALIQHFGLEEAGDTETGGPLPS